MAPRSPVNRFVSFILFAALALLCIYQGSQYRDESRGPSHFERSVADDGAIPPGKDPGEELNRYLLSKRAPAENAEVAARKGQGLMCYLTAIDVDEDLHTEWTDPKDMDQWYSSYPYETHTSEPTDTGKSLSTALSALGCPQTLEIETEGV